MQTWECSSRNEFDCTSLTSLFDYYFTECDMVIRSASDEGERTFLHSQSNMLTHSPGSIGSDADFFHDMTSVDLQSGAAPSSLASSCGCGSSKFTLKSPPVGRALSRG